MKHNSGQRKFLCEITDNHVKVVKASDKARVVGIEIESLAEAKDPEARNRRVVALFKKMNYRLEPVILCLPSSRAICRFLKVPTLDTAEIQKIISLQASTYLPYAPEELVTAYEIISSDSEGYSYVNMMILPKEAIASYLEMIALLRAKSVDVFLSAYGIVRRFQSLRLGLSQPVFVVCADASRIELMIVRGGKMLVNHLLAITSLDAASIENLFLDEIHKVNKLYGDEFSKEKIEKIFVFAAKQEFKDLFERICPSLGLSVEFLDGAEKLDIDPGVRKVLSASEYSFVPMLGLEIGPLEATASLMPFEHKRKAREKTKHRILTTQAVSLIVAMMIFILGVFQTITNRTQQLRGLQKELLTIENEGKVLEALEKRIVLRENRIKSEGLIVDLLHELFQKTPASIIFEQLTYDDGKQLVLAGQAPDLNTILTFVSQLESAPAFRKFQVKIRYATKQTTAAGGKTDFEVFCSRRK
jgi:hypothetical protein